MKNQQGFTLLELLVYIVILSIVSLAVVGIFVAIGRGQGQVEVRSEVNSNLRFAVEKISQDIRAASAVTTPGVTASAFDTDGIFNTDPSTSIDTYRDAVVDGDYIYLAGYQDAVGGPCASTVSCWRVEKRDKITGGLVNAFNTDGIYVLDGTGNERAYGLAVDPNYVYVAGSQFVGCSSGCWQIVKLDKTTGNPVSGFGTNGIVTSDASTGSDIAYDIVIDENFMYVSGDQGASCTLGGTCWRMEKRNLSNGSLVSAFNGGAGLVIDPTSGSPETAWAIAIDSNYVYIAGTQNAEAGCNITCGRIEKRDIISGGLVSGFGTGGILKIDPSVAAGDDIFSFTLDNQANLIVALSVQNNASCGTGNTCIQLEKRTVQDGGLVGTFGSGGIVYINPYAGSDLAYKVLIDSEYIYTTGYNNGNCGVGSWCLLTAKNSLITGNPVNAFDSDGIYTYDPTATNDVGFGLALDSDAVYAVGKQGTGIGCSVGSDCLLALKLWKSNGGLADGAYGDTSNTLALTVGGQSITYCVAANQLRRLVGAGTCDAASPAITSDKVRVSTSSFTRLANTNTVLSKTVTSIKIDLTVNSIAAAGENYFSSNKKTTVSLK